MTEIIKTAVNKQQYAGPETGNLMASVKKIILVIGPRSLMAVGYGDSGTVLGIRYTDYNNVPGDWISDFYEHQFITEPMLSDGDKITSVFISTDRTMLVPSVLYNTDAATKWIGKTQLVEADDIVSAWQADSDKAQVVYVWPQMIQDLLKRYFPKTKVLPLNAVQLGKTGKKVNQVKCIIGAQLANIAIYVEGKLACCETIPYTAAEDIAYRIQHVLRAHGLDTAEVIAMATGTELVLVIGRLAQYFPELTVGNEANYMTQNSWEAALALSRQLYTCA